MQLSSFMTMVEEDDFIDLRQLQQKYSVVKTNELISFLNRYFYERTDLKINSCFLVSSLFFTKLDTRIFTYTHEHLTDTCSITIAEFILKFINRFETSEILKSIFFLKEASNIDKQVNFLKKFFKNNIQTSLNMTTFLTILLKNDYLTEKEKNALQHLIDSSFIKNKQKNTQPLIRASILLVFLALVFENNFLGILISQIATILFLHENNFSFSLIYLLFPANLNNLKYLKTYLAKLELIQKNAVISQVLDVTPMFNFLFTLSDDNMSIDINDFSVTQTAIVEKSDFIFNKSLFTEKQLQLWKYVQDNYQTESFTIQKLEKDFANAAYATVRSFVLKFVELGLLTGEKYTNKVKYSINK